MIFCPLANDRRQHYAHAWEKAVRQRTEVWLRSNVRSSFIVTGIFWSQAATGPLTLAAIIRRALGLTGFSRDSVLLADLNATVQIYRTAFVIPFRVNHWAVRLSQANIEVASLLTDTGEIHGRGGRDERTEPDEGDGWDGFGTTAGRCGRSGGRTGQ